MRELERVQHRYDSRTGSVARQFDRICNVLNELGYLDRLDEGAKEHIDYRLTERGQLLRHLYSELDLVLAQAIDDGAFDGLDATELASAVMSLITSTQRQRGRAAPLSRRNAGNVAVCAAQLKGVHASIAMLCEDYALDEPRQLDFGITDVVYEWAQGESLSRVLYGTDLTGGDFVRGCKRLADVLQQIAVAGPYLGKRAETLAPIAKQAYENVNRGIVAYSGVD